MLSRRRALTCAAALCAAVAAAGPVAAQAVLVVDRQRVLSESAPARALSELELDWHRSRSADLDALRVAFEAEEAELVELRRSLPTEEFEARARAFDQKVRAARVATQNETAASNAEFAEARRRIAAALTPILSAVAEERGAAVVVDARSAVWVSAEVDVTEEAIRRLDGVEIDFDLTPSAASGGE